MTPVFPAIQAALAFVITPSDDNDISEDAANTDEVKMVFVHNPDAGGVVTVIPAGMSPDADAVGVYIPQGGTCPLAVRRVLATGTVPSGLIAFYTKQR